MSKLCQSCEVGEIKYLGHCTTFLWTQLVCEECKQSFEKNWKCDQFEDLETIITFNKFSKINAKRCESPRPDGFGENIKEFGPDHWLKAFNEEVGEINGAILGMTGKKERKKHLTIDDALDEIGDAAACLDLLAQSLGSNLGECTVKKFNKVSNRIGSCIRV